MATAITFLETGAVPDQASPRASASPVREPAGRTRWTVGLVIAGAVAVVAIGILGPRSSPGPQASASTAITAAGLPVVSGLSASQSGSDVTVRGAAGGEVGTLVVALEVGSTVLAATEVVPEDGRFAVTLRPRVPPGGLIARCTVRPAADRRAFQAVEAPIVLEATTAFRRSVDPLTGRTRLTAPRP